LKISGVRPSLLQSFDCRRLKGVPAPGRERASGDGGDHLGGDPEIAADCLSGDFWDGFEVAAVHAVGKAASDVG